jgi:ABC-2 type transport system ATP-binding protein
MIKVEGLTKYYGAHAAIKDLTFEIQKGEVIGFLGLNGAGKSTTLRVLGCVLLPTSGRVTIDGFDVVRDPHEIRKRIGFLPDTPPLYNEMTVDNYLAFVADLRGVASEDIKKRVQESQERTGLRDVHDAVIGTLSHGYRQRVGLAQAIVHQPKLLILDEPTSGLDPVQIVEMRTLIKNLRGAHTILLSSHNLPEISQTCDRLLVIQEGQIVGAGSEADLRTRQGATGPIVIEIGGSGEFAPAEKAQGLLKAVDGVTAVTIESQEKGVAVLHVTAAGAVRPKLVKALVQADIDVMAVRSGDGQLESIFLKLTQGKGN